MVGSLTMSKVLFRPNAHSWQTTIFSFNKNRLHPYLKEGKQLVPNGHLKSRQKLMAQFVTTLAFSSRPRQRLARLQAKKGSP